MSIFMKIGQSERNFNYEKLQVGGKEKEPKLFSMNSHLFFFQPTASHKHRHHNFIDFSNDLGLVQFLHFKFNFEKLT